VGVELEDLAVVDADAFKDAIAVEKAMIVNAYLGIIFVVKLSVDPDFKGHRVGIITGETGNAECGLPNAE
jgi:hypothetical protein